MSIEIYITESNSILIYLLLFTFFINDFIKFIQRIINIIINFNSKLVKTKNKPPCKEQYFKKKTQLQNQI